MLYALSILCFLFHLSFSFVNTKKQFENKKILYSSIFSLALLSFFQILDYFFISFTNLTYKNFQMLNYLIFFIVCVGAIILILFFCNKNNISFKNLFNVEHLKFFIKNNYLFIISIILFSIVIIFTNNDFVDLGKYMDISSQFQFDKIPNLNDPYRYASSYYVYSSFNNQDIPVWFNFFTPYIWTLIVCSIINDTTTLVFKDNLLNIKKSFIYVIYVLLSIFFVPFISSGNLLIPAILLVLILTFLYLRQHLLCSLVLISSQFFSTTGILVSIIFCVSMFLYFFIFKKLKYIFKNSFLFFLPLLTAGSFISISLTNSINTIKIISILFFIGFLCLSLLCNLIYYFYINKNNKLNLNISDNKFINSKISFVILSIISCLLIIFNIIYFMKIYQAQQYYSSLFMIISSIFLLTMIMIMIYYNFYLKHNKNYKLLFLIIITLFISSLLILIFWVAKIKNDSFWRIEFTSICLPLPESSFVLIFIGFLFFYNLWIAKLGNIFKNLILSHLSIKNKKLAISFLLIPTFAACSIPIIYSQVNVQTIKPELIHFNSNINKNLNLFDQTDINLLNQFAISHNNYSYASDAMVSIYLNKSINITNSSVSFAKNIYHSYELTDNRYWAYNRLDFYNAKINNTNIKNVSLEEFIGLMNNVLISNNYQVDYLFLNKNTEYYSKLYIDQSKIIDQSNNIIILKK